MKHTLLFLFVFLQCSLWAQDKSLQTFKDTRIINAHSVEVLAKHKLDIRIGHRFGDFIGDNGGWKNFYGFENVADVMIGAEYGVTDKLTIGLNRTKGVGDLKALINPLVKYQIIKQSEGGPPLTLTALVVGSISTAQRNENSNGVNSFPKFSHRMAYAIQFLAAKKVGDKLSIQLTPSYTHRNLVDFEDNNNVISLGLSGRYQMTKVIAVLMDYTLPLNGVQSPFTENTEGLNYYAPFGIGLEWDTGGHVFQVNLTNARGIIETDYIPNTQSSWSKGAFRIGFTISRMFNL